MGAHRFRVMSIEGMPGFYTRRQIGLLREARLLHEAADRALLIGTTHAITREIVAAMARKELADSR